MTNNQDNDLRIWAKHNGITLKEHTEEVMENFKELANSLGDKLPYETKKCIMFSIILHDIGKILPYFQIKILGNKEYKPFDINPDMYIYHSLASVLFINQDNLKNEINDKDLKYVLSAIAYHHWKSSLENDLRFGAQKVQKLLNYENKNLLINILKNELSDLLKTCFNNIENVIQFNEDICGGIANGLSFSEYVIPPYQMYWLPKRLETDEEGKKKWILISGFLQRCDHFASFCEEDNCLIKSNDEKQKILKDIEIENNPNFNILDKIKEEIKKKQNQNMNNNNSNINLWQEFKLKEENGKYKNNLILIAPTGSGKTEFAFLWSQGEKFFYTLPLRAAVEQIYDRATKIFEDGKVGLIHSDADVYLFEKNNSYEKVKTYEVAKQLSYPVIVSTGDQFFPYALRPPGYERIYATFSYSKLVIDEIQAYDPKAAAIIVKYIEDIFRLGGKFLLITATLPEYVKKEIENRIGNNNFFQLNLYEIENRKYETLKKHKLNFLKINNSSNENRIEFTIPDNIIDEIINKAKQNRVLVILNTIKQAKSVYNKIKEYIEKENTKKSHISIKDENIILFHSQLTLNEKQKIKNEIETKFKNPKDQNENEGKILVATQVIEAAIDIDADILYTEICPMDVLVQRTGRVLRRYNDNFSLEDNSEPNVIVLIFKNNYESGNCRVYDRELIEKTLIYLDNPNYEVTKVRAEKNSPSIENTTDNAHGKSQKGKNSIEFSLESLKNLFNNKNYKVLLSEYQKLILVEKLYRSLDQSGKYLSNFYETLSILDAGFMSDRREEAQRIFREIINVEVVEKTKEEDFKKKITDITKENDFNFTKFKKEIIAQFVISIPYYQLDKIKAGKLEDWIAPLEIDKDKKKKIFNWCEDIFIVEIVDKYNKPLNNK